jgi:antitoxin HigA-1
MNTMHNPAHPGQVLKEGWPEDTTITAAAKQLGITRAALSRILNGHAAISAEMALRLQDWIGIPAKLFMDMQSNYDLWQAQSRRVHPISTPRKQPKQAA